MRVALAQLNPTSGDLHGNTTRLLDAIARARDHGADLLVAPEMVLPGYCIGDLIENVRFLQANEQAVRRVAEAAAGITVVAGFIDADPGRRGETGGVLRYNAAAVVRDGCVLQRARKSLLPTYRYFDDRRYFAPAESRQPVRIETRKGPVALGVSICEDMWDEFYPVKPLAELSSAGAQVLLNINASPFYPGKRRERDALIRRHVRELGRAIVYVNTVGAADNGKNVIPFDGESLVYDAAGRLLAVGPQFREDLILVDLEAKPGEGPQIAPEHREREIYDALLMSLRDYMRKTGFTRAVVPVSGGIDSALVLALAADALGPGQVTAFNLPSRYNTEVTRSIAARVAGAFGVRYGVIPIQEIDDRVREVFEAHAHPIARGTTRENLHARIRGLLMMAESNDTDALLLSCGNETEIALGYATLYGDMCGGLSLIGDLSKIDVYRLARAVNDRHRTPMIPEETFRLTPSAELAPGQVDPFDYYVVAPIVGEFVETRRSPSELVALFEQGALDPLRFLNDPDGRSVYDKHTVETFQAVVADAFGRMRRSVYKRLQGPPIVAVTARAFGFDLRETIINEWKGR
ncbi:MAG TPA: NAD(+) synthase [Vicinamibacterales bacterium]|nr:NAD(+) synthase [Vicinamibacterales bacterium]